MNRTTLLLLALLLSSCYTQKKAAQQTSKAYLTYPGPFAQQVVKWFPPKVYDSTRVEIRPGKVTYLPGDTIVIDCDSVVKQTQSYIIGHKQAPRTSIVRIPCPPSTHQYDSFLTIQTIQTENTMAIAAKDAELAQERAKGADLTKENQQKDKKIRTLTSVCIWGGGIIAIVLLGLMWFLKR